MNKNNHGSDENYDFAIATPVNTTLVATQESLSLDGLEIISTTQETNTGIEDEGDGDEISGGRRGDGVGEVLR